MTLTDYILDNAPVVVTLTTSDGASISAAVSSPADLPFNGSLVNDRGSLYVFEWDGIGILLDGRGKRILGISAFPYSERSGESAKIFP